MHLAENQDIFLHDENALIEAVVLADGVSGSRLGKLGAQIACDTVMQILLAEGKHLFTMSKELVAHLIIERIMDKITQEKLCDLPSDCASTLAFACRDKAEGKLLTFTLGDTLLYTVSDTDCDLISQPDTDTEGKCCVTTTEDAAQRVSITMRDTADQSAVMLCTDGAWQSMYEDSRLNGELKSEIIAGNYDALKKHLQATMPDDDSSFIIMKLPQNNA